MRNTCFHAPIIQLRLSKSLRQRYHGRIDSLRTVLLCLARICLIKASWGLLHLMTDSDEMQLINKLFLHPSQFQIKFGQTTTGKERKHLSFVSSMPSYHVKHEHLFYSIANLHVTSSMFPSAYYGRLSPSISHFLPDLPFHVSELLKVSNDAPNFLHGAEERMDVSMR